MTEDQLEQETLGWLAEVGYTHLYGPTIAHDGDSPERENYRQVLLIERLRSAITRLNRMSCACRWRGKRSSFIRRWPIGLGSGS